MVDAILLALAPVFFVLALGYAAGRLHFVDNKHVEALNTLVISIALPAALFVTTASASRSEILAQAPLFAILAAVWLIVYVGWFVFAARWTTKANASVQALTIAYPNLAGVGLPLAASVLGASQTMPVAVGVASGSIIVSPLTLILLELTRPGAQGSARARMMNALRRALTKPVVVAPALGILASLSGLQLGAVTTACFMLIGKAAPGIALFLSGLVLSSQPFHLDRRVVGATVVGDVARPLLAAALVFILPVSPDVAKVAILLAAVPSGFFGILFAVTYRCNSAAAGSMVTASTVVSIVTLAIAIAVLFPR